MRALLFWMMSTGAVAVANSDAEPPATNSPAVPTISAVAPPKPASAPKSAGKSAHAAPVAQTAAQMQAALDQLAQSNHELLDLLKKQQAVLEDMQFDRRVQDRQTQSLEVRLEETLTEKHQLEEKILTLEAQAAVRPATTSAPLPAETFGSAVTPDVAIRPAPVLPPPPETHEVVPRPAPPEDIPPPPATYLPPASTEASPNAPSWHRLVSLKGDGNRQTPLFTIQGKTWRVLWHNQDKPGKTYLNTSALFVSAFPKDDTIPQKICSKLGSGGDSTELQGSGTYYLKVEASGGSWELAVEDFH